MFIVCERVCMYGICACVCAWVQSIHVEARGICKMSSSIAVHFIIIFKILIN